MLFSLSLPQRHTIDNIVTLGVKSEELNYNGIWLGDHYFNRNVFITLGLLSRSTDRILLGTGVTNPFHLSPAMLASTGCSLQELSSGRFRMGIGTGDTQSLLDEGITKPPDLLRVMANHIKFMKRLSSGNSLKNPSQENAGSLPAMINYAGKKTIFPVMLGALGTRMIELAANCCDGVLINSSSIDDAKRAVGIVNRIRQKHNLTNDFQIIPFTLVEVNDGEKPPSEFTKGIIAKIVSDLPVKYIKERGLSMEAVQDIKNALIQNDAGRLMKLIDKQFINTFSITGTMDEVVKQLLEFERIGIREIIIGGTGYPNDFTGFIKDISHHLPLSEGN